MEPERREPYLDYCIRNHLNPYHKSSMRDERDVSMIRELEEVRHRYEALERIERNQIIRKYARMEP